jgi:hypothetical protein
MACCRPHGERVPRGFMIQGSTVTRLRRCRTAASTSSRSRLIVGKADTHDESESRGVVERRD